MKKRLCWLLALCWLLQCQVAFSKDADQVKMNRESYDFGEINGNRLDPLVADFEIANTSDVAIGIKKVAASCTCTDVKLASYTIEPKGKTNLHVSLNPTGNSGKVQGAVVIEFQDGSTRMAQVSAYRQNYLSADIVKVQFEQGDGEEVSAFRVSVIARDFLANSTLQACHCYSLNGRVFPWIASIEVPKVRSQISGYFHYVLSISVARFRGVDSSDRIRCGSEELGYVEVETGSSKLSVESINPRMISLGNIKAGNYQNVSFTVDGVVNEEKIASVQFEGKPQRFQIRNGTDASLRVEVEGIVFNAAGYQRGVLQVLDAAGAILAEGSVMANVSR